MLGDRVVVGGRGDLAAGDHRRRFRRRREGVVLAGGWHCSAREVSWKYSSRGSIYGSEEGEGENRWEFGIFRKAKYSSSSIE